MDNRIAETADEWIERESGIQVDVMFRPVASFEAHFLYLFEKFEARPGYSTAVWHNVRSSTILFDREGWFARLQQQTDQPYPEELARAIIALNVPLLHGAINSRAAQAKLAARRGDMVAVNSALTKLLASYFDVLFALNRTLHPGEKRQLTFISTLADVPLNAARDIERLLSFTKATLHEVPNHIEAVVIPLLRLLKKRRQMPTFAGPP
ncbi:DUF4037 domain-containing protein [Deinococcus apachensis]|uniref:DUF4037 domain-containing protein n=1 Tax=Deinococcus apachensis TaxID=309886 RepID=UPI00036024CD|nr:DUF4037 domain-containing protein [Deinococcus apachensis]